MQSDGLSGKAGAPMARSNTIGGNTQPHWQKNPSQQLPWSA